MYRIKESVELVQLSFCGYYVKTKKPSPAGQHGSIQDFVPVDCLSLGGNWRAVCILISFGGDTQSAHPELRSGSDECLAVPSHAVNK